MHNFFEMFDNARGRVTFIEPLVICCHCKKNNKICKEDEIFFKQHAQALLRCEKCNKWSLANWDVAMSEPITDIFQDGLYKMGLCGKDVIAPPVGPDFIEALVENSIEPQSALNLLRLIYLGDVPKRSSIPKGFSGMFLNKRTDYEPKRKAKPIKTLEEINKRKYLNIKKCFVQSTPSGDNIIMETQLEVPHTGDNPPVIIRVPQGSGSHFCKDQLGIENVKVLES